MSAPDEPPTGHLSGAWNFRDVAESTGGAIRPGLLFRSGELTRLDDTGIDQLRDLRVTDVADLRSAREVERHGADLVPGGVDVHLLPFVDVVAAVDGEAPHEHAFRRLMTEKPDAESTVDAAKRYMSEEYTRFATAPGASRAVHRMVTLLSRGATVLTHCFAGKDRTGFGVAVVLGAAGVDRDAVMSDYLRSNAAVPQLRVQVMEMISRRFDGNMPAEAAEFTETRLSDDVLGVREEYLSCALQVVEREFGSLQGYLRAAGIDDDTVRGLRSALLG
ncbi:tyrosine-protein phosphatase [Mycolicibacterium palauense]|uniref:tyrosine-protein phosphatase n=1 Tax=Mycolicibacterium palauense TaxID=2034511 RepID=UPI001FEA3F59|nr:tyrosine-protein phosphatase [Mycolicibacterium palauense]